MALPFGDEGCSARLMTKRRHGRSVIPSEQPSPFPNNPVLSGVR